MPLRLVGETIDKTRSHYLAGTGKLVQLMRGVYVDADDDIDRTVDLAYVDGTFFDASEVAHRDVTAIPHPFVETSLAHFADLPAGERAKIRFIHLNHTNPLLDPGSAAHARVRAAGFGVAAEGEITQL